jgi:hypothetical protein
LIAKFDEIGLWMIATLLATLQKWKKNAMDVSGCVTQWFFWTNFVIFQQNFLGKYQKNGIVSVNLTNFAQCILEKFAISKNFKKTYWVRLWNQLPSNGCYYVIICSLEINQFRWILL